MSSRRTRSLLAVLLIGVFALVLVPRQWLHHCELAGPDHHDVSTPALHAEQDCAICQVLIASFDNSCVPLILPAVPSSLLEYQEAAQALMHASVHPAASRGPPQLGIV